jgi:hypothetical protein
MPNWVPMREAARILQAEGFKISPNVISRLAGRNTIQTKNDPVDTRVKLVSLEELRQIFADRRSEASSQN